MLADECVCAVDALVERGCGRVNICVVAAEMLGEDGNKSRSRATWLDGHGSYQG